MKKASFILLFLITTSITCSAQSSFFKKLYGKVEGGYGLFTPGAFKATTAASLALTDSSTSSQSKEGLGGGFRLGLGLGYVQNDFINFGIDAEYTNQKGFKDRSAILKDSINYASDDETIEYSFVTLTPYIIFKALARPRFYLYNKLGVLITLPFKLKTREIDLISYGEQFPRGDNYYNGVEYPNSIETRKQTDFETFDVNYKMSLGVGLNVAFGINYKISNKFRAFFEIFGNYSSLSPASDITYYNIKRALTERFDSTGFRFEESTKDLNQYIYNNEYIKASRSGVLTTQTATEDLGVDAEGYHVTRISLDQKNLKRTLDLTVIGINAGIICRF